jgi:hypothetical protein
MQIDFTPNQAQAFRALCAASPGSVPSASLTGIMSQNAFYVAIAGLQAIFAERRLPIVIDRTSYGFHVAGRIDAIHAVYHMATIAVVEEAQADTLASNQDRMAGFVLPFVRATPSSMIGLGA